MNIVFEASSEDQDASNSGIMFTARRSSADLLGTAGSKAYGGSADGKQRPNQGTVEF